MSALQRLMTFGRNVPGSQLPADAKAILQGLLDRRDNSHALGTGIPARHDEVRELVSNLRRDISVRVNNHRDNRPRFSEAEDTELARMREELTASEAELARLQTQSAENFEKAHAAARLISRLQTYLETHGSELVAFKGGGKPRFGGDDHAIVRKAREAIASHREAVRQAECRPHRSEAAKARAVAHINALAEGGAPNVLPMVEVGVDEIGWPVHMARLPLVAVVEGADIAGFARGSQVDALALLCWLHRDELIKKVSLQIDAVADDRNALSDEGRAEAIAKIKQAILAAEREEEAAIRRLGEIGHVIERRIDCDPRAVLGIDGPEPKM